MSGILPGKTDKGKSKQKQHLKTHSESAQRANTLARNRWNVSAFKETVAEVYPSVAYLSPSATATRTKIYYRGKAAYRQQQPIAPHLPYSVYYTQTMGGKKCRNISGAVREVATHKTLDALERGRVSRRDWQTWAVQRYKASAGFKALLEAGAERAEAQGLNMLAASTVWAGLGEVLRENLADELGVMDGVVQQELVHEGWRVECYRGMGVGEEQLKSLGALFGSTLSLGIAEYLTQWASPLQISGAILFLEMFIPLEFRRVRKGLYAAFPEAFADRPNDNASTRAQKQHARRYLDDHIEHDSRDHFPKLLVALAHCVHTKAELAEVRQGIRQMADARRHFYTSLARSFRLPAERRDTT